MAPKYLCCLPLRLGVLVISFLQFVASGAVAAFLVIALILNAEDKADAMNVPVASTTKARAIFIVLVILYAGVALISLTGFIGAIRKKESYVGIFSNLLRLFLGLQVVAMIAYIAIYFIDKSGFQKVCIGNSTDQQVIDACNSATNSSSWVVIVSAIIPLIFQAYGVYIVSSYVTKLRNEKVISEESFGFKGPGYAPVPNDFEQYPLTNKPPAYAYAENSHSFGASHV
ncbi:hypothetical protein C8F04DRAFT_318379 [Mycena alexandri]|uniref:Uncharacterized protein n=1 Tax=Mycena alexandri TaxID=1745969 RepID=A0AAD6T4E9_9AGAR|nr:hypothetical protein C8F04DRAFT_318379 [Mycena alexandri]